jgi:hypothetical protein
MSLQFSFYNQDSENTNVKQNKEKQEKNNKKNIEKIKAMLHKNESPYLVEEEDGENSLANFVPLNYPKMNSIGKRRKQKKEKEATKLNYDANDISIEDDSQISEANKDQSDHYYKQYSSNYQYKDPVQTMQTSKDELMEKLNYVIHLLEEQSDEKTANVTEELILYCFLGVFVIFVLDSFAKIGKYVR